MLESYDGRFRETEGLSGEKAAMPADNIVIAVGQDRYDEAKDFHAARDLLDLARSVVPRILGIEDKGAKREIGDNKPAERDQLFHCTLPM
jgi:hypothetical protein